MDAFIARQPILDGNLEVYAYELLFRSSGLKDYFDGSDADQASSNVIAGSLFLPKLDSLTGGHPAFVNVTRELLVQDWVSVLPPQAAVIELLETIEPDAQVVAACRQLKERGYRLALDDFSYSPAWEPLLKMADIVKVDVMATGPQERAAMARRLQPTGVTLLAEKVESQEVLQEVRALGYRLFQGYFFARPTTVPGRDIPASRLHHLQLLREIHRPGLDFDALESIIEHEVALSYKLLRYINSAAFGFRGQVDSIRHALMLLGEREIKKWASVICLAGMASDKPDELVTQALLRGRHCELLAPEAGLASRSQDLFLMGSFSLIDAMLDHPLPDILKEIPIAEDVKAALLGEPGLLRDLFEVVLAYGECDWAGVSQRAAKIDLEETVIPSHYLDAIRWCDESLEHGGEALAA